jgi:hypothetical protein
MLVNIPKLRNEKYTLTGLDFFQQPLLGALQTNKQPLHQFWMQKQDRVWGIK